MQANCSSNDKFEDKDNTIASNTLNSVQNTELAVVNETLNVPSTPAPARKRKRTPREIKSLDDLKPLRRRRARMTHTIEVKLNGAVGRVVDFQKFLIQKLEDLAQKEQDQDSNAADNSNSEEELYSETEPQGSNEGSEELTCTDAEDLGEDDSDVTETSEEEDQEEEELDPFFKNLLQKAQTGAYEGYSDDPTHDLGDYDYSDNFVDDSELIKKPEINTPNKLRKTKNVQDSEVSDNDDISKWFVHYGPLPQQPKSDVIKPALNPFANKAKPSDASVIKKDTTNGDKASDIHISQPSKPINTPDTKKAPLDGNKILIPSASQASKAVNTPVIKKISTVENKTLSPHTSQSTKHINNSILNKNPANEDKSSTSATSQPSKPLATSTPKKKIDTKTNYGNNNTKSVSENKITKPSSSVSERSLAQNDEPQKSVIPKSTAEKSDSEKATKIKPAPTEVLKEIESLFVTLQSEVNKLTRENFVTVVIQTILSRLLCLHAIYRLESSGTPPTPFFARLKQVLPFQDPHIRTIILKRFPKEQIKIINRERTKLYDNLKKHITNFEEQLEAETNKSHESSLKLFPWNHTTRVLLGNLDQIEWDIHDLSYEAQDKDAITTIKPTRQQVRKSFYATLSEMFPDGSADSISFSKAVSYAKLHITSMVPDDDFVQILLLKAPSASGKDTTVKTGTSKPGTAEPNKSAPKLTKPISKTFQPIGILKHPSTSSTSPSSGTSDFSPNESAPDKLEPSNLSNTPLKKSKLATTSFKSSESLSSAKSTINKHKKTSSSNHQKNTNTSKDSQNLVRVTRVDVGAGNTNHYTQVSNFTTSDKSTFDPMIRHQHTQSSHKRATNGELFASRDDSKKHRMDRGPEASYSASHLGAHTPTKRAHGLDYILESSSSTIYERGPQAAESPSSILNRFAQSRPENSLNSEKSKKKSREYSQTGERTNDFRPNYSHNRFSNPMTQNSNVSHFDRSPRSPGLERNTNPDKYHVHRTDNRQIPRQTTTQVSSSNLRDSIARPSSPSASQRRPLLSSTRNPNPLPHAESSAADAGPIDLTTSSPSVSPKPIRFIHYKG